ncbi:interferon-induced, double-stranded RNA-activated protein kinase [Discoglossus pictus]
MDDQNCKGKLITFCLKHGLKLDVREEMMTGPPHDHSFTFSAYINGIKRGEGQDKTKRLAANIAAKTALLWLHANPNQLLAPSPAVVPVSASTSPVPAAAEAVSNSAASEIQKRCDEGPEIIQNLEEKMAASMAKEDPASKVVPAATDEPLQSAPSELQPSPSASEAQPSVNAVEFLSNANYIGKLNELCQKKKWSNSFLDERRGLPHISEFFCKAVVKEETFPEATGKNKKEARQNAAYQALRELRRQYPQDITMPLLGDSYSSGSENSSISGSGVGDENGAVVSATTDSENLSSIKKLSTPSRTQRKVELAPKFGNGAQEINHRCTNDKTFLKEFEDITDIDSGAFGTVFKARKCVDKTYYAVKKVKLQDSKSLDEVTTLARLEHVNIVRYFHAWPGEDFYSDSSCTGSQSDNSRSIQSCLFIQMEWCEGGTLEKWIMSMEKVDEENSLKISQQITEGVEYIHSQGLIHRDLKPANIFFAKNQKVKIGDFGLVTRMTGEDESAICRTHRTGTPSYMAPEQCEKLYENEVDIFSLGLIVFELFWIFGSRHERGKEWSQIRNAELPKRFEKQYPCESSLIKKMLSRNPHDRPKASTLKDFLGKTVFLSAKTC